jgi:hypothetical protein
LEIEPIEEYILKTRIRDAVGVVNNAVEPTITSAEGGPRPYGVEVKFGVNVTRPGRTQRPPPRGRATDRK